MMYMERKKVFTSGKLYCWARLVGLMRDGGIRTISFFTEMVVKRTRAMEHKSLSARLLRKAILTIFVFSMENERRLSRGRERREE